MNWKQRVVSLNILIVCIATGSGCASKPPDTTIPVPETIFFPGDIVGHVLNEEVGGVVVESKKFFNGEFPPGWNYRIRRLDIVFSDVWLSEAELVLIKEASNRPTNALPSQKAKKYKSPAAEAQDNSVLKLEKK